ncbi:hypothetical protein [Candidatus Lokiarchaeum ossiferum]
MKYRPKSNNDLKDGLTKNEVVNDLLNKSCLNIPDSYGLFNFLALRESLKMNSKLIIRTIFLVGIFVFAYINAIDFSFELRGYGAFFSLIFLTLTQLIYILNRNDILNEKETLNFFYLFIVFCNIIAWFFGIDVMGTFSHRMDDYIFSFLIGIFIFHILFKMESTLSIPGILIESNSLVKSFICGIKESFKDLKEKLGNRISIIILFPSLFILMVIVVGLIIPSILFLLVSVFIIVGMIFLKIIGFNWKLENDVRNIIKHYIQTAVYSFFLTFYLYFEVIIYRSYLLSSIRFTVVLIFILLAFNVKSKLKIDIRLLILMIPLISFGFMGIFYWLTYNYSNFDYTLFFFAMIISLVLIKFVLSLEKPVILQSNSQKLIFFNSTKFLIKIVGRILFFGVIVNINFIQFVVESYLYDLTGNNIFNFIALWILWELGYYYYICKFYQLKFKKKKLDDRIFIVCFILSLFSLLTNISVLETIDFISSINNWDLMIIPAIINFITILLLELRRARFFLINQDKKASKNEYFCSYCKKPIYSVRASVDSESNVIICNFCGKEIQIEEFRDFNEEELRKEHEKILNDIQSSKNV